MTSSSADTRFVAAFPAVPAQPVPAGPAGRFTAAYRTDAIAAAAIAAAAADRGTATAATAPTGVRVGERHEQSGDLLHGERAGVAATARFDVDLREQPTLPGGLADRLRAEAEAAGYAVGWAQGRREAELAARAARDQEQARATETAAAQATRVGQALNAVVGAAGSLEARMVPVAADLEDLIVSTAYALAEQIIGRELAAAAEPGRDAIARALAYAPANRPVTVRLHPSDYATVTQAQPGLVEIEGRTVSLLADATMRPGDAVAECDATTIDARIEPTLARVREVLGL